jgi:hypothetical protein
VAKYVFTATHGVHLSKDGVNVLAHFVRDRTAPERDSVNWKTVYRFETDDVKVAEAVRKVKGYGIVEETAEAVEGE